MTTPLTLVPLTPTPLVGLPLTFPLVTTDSIVATNFTLGSGTISGRISGQVKFGSGDEQQLFFPTHGQAIHVLSGTAASPDTALHPLIKATRTLAIGQTAAITSIVGNGVTVTVVTATPHYLETGLTATIAGTSAFNVSQTSTITVTSPTSFTYASSVTGSEATGTATVGGNVAEQQAAITGLCYGVTGNGLQVTGLAGIGINASTTVDPRNDVAGGYFFGQITGASSVNGAEASFHGTQRTIAGTFAETIEIQCRNSTLTAGAPIFGSATVTFDTSADTVTYTNHGLIAGDLIAFTTTGSLPGGILASTDTSPHAYYVYNVTDANTFQLSLAWPGSAINLTGSPSGTHTAYPHPGAAYNPSTYSRASCLGISAGASAEGTMVGVGIQFVRAGKAAIDVGIGAPAWSAISDGRGAIRQALIRDDGQSLNSILIKGAHSAGAIAIDNGAGQLLVGNLTQVLGGSTTNSLVEIWSAQTTSTALLTLGEQGGTSGSATSQGLTIRNQTGTFRLSVIGQVTGLFGLTGLTNGDGILTTSATGTHVHICSSVKPVVSVARDGKLSFNGATPIAAPAAYTQTYSTASRVVNPAATSAFTGQDNTQAGTVYAKVADLNTLRTDMLALAQNVNSLIDDFQPTSGYGLLQ